MTSVADLRLVEVTARRPTVPRRPRGRPRTGAVVEVRLPLPLLDVLREIASRRGLPLAAVIRGFLARAICAGQKSTSPITPESMGHARNPRDAGASDDLGRGTDRAQV